MVTIWTESTAETTKLQTPLRDTSTPLDLPAWGQIIAIQMTAVSRHVCEGDQWEARVGITTSSSGGEIQ